MYLDLSENYEIKAFIDKSDFWFDVGKIDEIENVEQQIFNYKF